MPKTGKSDPLLASLANLKPRAEVPERGEETASQARPTRSKVTPPPPAQESPATDKLAPSFSISVYESDFDRMEKVRRLLTSHGLRSANKSELLRLGLRFAAESEENAVRLAEIFREMKAQDGRRKVA